MLRAQSSGRSAILIAASSSPIPLTGTVAETVMATVTIPAGAMGLNGGIEIRSGWTITNSANTKTLRYRLAGIGGTQFMAAVLTANLTLTDIRRIRNRNATNSQIGSAPAPSLSAIGNSNNAFPTSAIDTTASQDLVLTGQLGLSTETITLESYEVWLLP